MSNSLNTNILPFFLLNDVEFLNFVSSFQSNNDLQFDHFNLTNLNKKVYNQFNYNFDNFLSETDPNNFFFDFQDKLDSKYYFSDSLIDLNKNLYNENSFSIVSFNINSLPKNFENFVNDILTDKDKNNSSIIGICESKLTNDICNLYDIPNYNMFVNNNTRQSGGLVLYVDNKIVNAFERKDLLRKTNCIETLFIEFEFNSHICLCGIIYHRPNSSKPEFLRELNVILETINSENKKTFLFGDFNVNLFEYENDNYVRDFVNMFHCNNMFNLINRSTRVSSSSATLLDHIWTNNYINCTVSGIIYNHISDHFPVFAVFKDFSLNKKEYNKKIEYKYRDFSEINKVKFKQELQDVNWFLVFASDNPNVSYDNFILIFLTLFNNIFPLKVRQVYENTIKNKYITNEIKSLIVKKNKLQRLYAKRPQTYGAEYKRIRNKVTNKLRSARAQFFRNKLTNSRGNSKQIWNTINDVLNRHKTKNNDTIEFTDEEGVKHSDPGSVADMFNKFFVNIGKILANQVIDEGSRPEDYFGVRIENNVNFGDTSFTEIEDLIANLGDAAAGCDNVPVKLVKFVINEIKAPLKHIFNCSLRTGIFPEKLKISKVIPIHKKDNKTEITNYRPISLLPVFSKILERLIYNRLELFLQNNKIIYSNQHGFQPKKSTTLALLNLTDNILESFDILCGCISRLFQSFRHSKP